MNQGYIPPSSADYQKQTKVHRSHQTQKNKRLMLFVLLAVGVIAVTVGVVIALGGNNKPQVRDASAIVQSLVDAGFPIENIVAYNAQTDPNSLLGRPNSYTSKVSFADKRITQYNSDPEGGTVEVFSSTADANARYLYVSTFSGSILGSYSYQFENVIMRISYQLTPDQAEEYRAALISK